jgi:eukaryotic-like serine/threonine-protein kinase
MLKEPITANTTVAHYRILSRLGAGGMGEVYLAEDTKLDRKVAIKFLPPQSIADEQAKKRLVREARAAAKLDHPNICAIYEIGEADGLTFIVMQNVEGETLAAKIQRKPMEVRESLDIAVQAAHPLAAAHSHGIIHRDIKPQNIMLTAHGQVKVLDFGLAKVVTNKGALESEAETQSLLTESGVIVGTVPYMSPEQVEGESLDARSDIFSFGAVLYEMLSGHQPFSAESAAATLSAILTREPLPLARYSDGVPTELERIVRKCLGKDRERRYQTIRDVAIDLENVRRECEAAAVTASPRERTTEIVDVLVTDKTGKQSPFASRRALGAAGLVVALIGAALAYALLFRGVPAARQPEIKSIAVLPLENLSGDPAQEFFADGMTEALISNLAQIRALKVISRTSVMRYKGSGKLLREIARELNVDAVLEGSVQRAGGRVRITAQLIQAASDTHLWARDYDRDPSDILRLQSEVASAVAEEIRIQVTAEERVRLASARSVNPQAHEAYLLGRYHLSKKNEDDLRQAIEHFERAIQLAPDYAAAYAGLSEAWQERGVWGTRTFIEVEPPARAAALKAIQWDEQLAEGHMMLAQLNYIYDWDWAGAEQQFKRALELDPGSLYVHRPYAVFLMAVGRHAEAISEMQRAAQLDPVSSEIQSNFGRILYRARKYDEAIPHFKRALELEPRSYSAYVRLGDVYGETGQV